MIVAARPSTRSQIALDATCEVASGNFGADVTAGGTAEPLGSNNPRDSGGLFESLRGYSAILRAVAATGVELLSKPIFAGFFHVLPVGSTLCRRVRLRFLLHFWRFIASIFASLFGLRVRIVAFVGR